MMSDEQRSVLVVQFMTGAKWMLALLGVLTVVIFVVTIGVLSDSRKQTLDAIADLRKQVEILRDQNHWSREDRAELHQGLGEIRAALKRPDTGGER
jgi:hypothetical protein